MPSRRELIRMSELELAAYLDGQRRIILVTNGPEGMPHPVPMNYGIDPQGRVILTSFAKGQKVRNLERDPRATLLVESGQDYGELKGAILWCEVEIVRDFHTMRALMQHMRSGGTEPFAAGSQRAQQVRASIGKRVVLLCTPFRTTSRDHARLGEAY